MKKIFLLGAIALSMAAMPAFAGENGNGGNYGHGSNGGTNASANANSNSHSTSTSSAGSYSSSKGGTSNVTVNGAGGSGSGSTNDTLRTYSQQSGSLTTVPDAVAPAIVGGNPCMVGGSAGISGLGFGVSLGVSTESANCERRQNAALLANMGEREAAREQMCDNRDVYNNFKRVGKPCAARPDWDPKEQPQAVSAPGFATTPAPAPVAPAPQAMAFNASNYATGAECLNAAAAAGASYSACAGMR